MIAPNRRNCRRKTQDGRELCRYGHRWKIERLFAWLHNFRRLVTRWKFYEATSRPRSNPAASKSF